jgi:hypothetical protein
MKPRNRTVRARPARASDQTRPCGSVALCLHPLAVRNLRMEDRRDTPPSRQSERRRSNASEWPGYPPRQVLELSIYCARRSHQRASNAPPAASNPDRFSEANRGVAASTLSSPPATQRARRKAPRRQSPLLTTAFRCAAAAKAARLSLQRSTKVSASDTHETARAARTEGIDSQQAESPAMARRRPPVARGIRLQPSPSRAGSKPHPSAREAFAPRTVRVATEGRLAKRLPAASPRRKPRNATLQRDVSS